MSETAPKGKSKAAAAAAVEAEPQAGKKYVTVAKHTYPLDIQIKGELIMGAWQRESGFVEFEVPEHLVEGFETHHHFAVGNIVAQ